MSEHTSTLRLRKDGPEYTVLLKSGLTPNQDSPALYHVTCRPGERRLEIELADAVKTHHAAVNGIQNELDRAALVMFDKVQATASLQRGAEPTEFTLFHVPTRGLQKDCSLASEEIARIRTDDAKALGAVLEKTSRSGQHVDWSVHSRGAAVFDAAVRDCNARRAKLEHQTVAVYNGAMNTMVMKHDLKQAGVEPLGRGFYNHPFDPVPQIVGLNSSNKYQTLLALCAAPKVATADQSLHTWHRELTPSDYRSVPERQWEKPGIDLRQNAAQTRQGTAPVPGKTLSAGKGFTTHGETFAVPLVNPEDAVLRTLSETIAAREAYAQADPTQRPGLLAECRQALEQTSCGPELTALPLRRDALGYVKGDRSADDLVDSALKHAAAIDRQHTLGLTQSGVDIGLAR